MQSSLKYILAIASTIALSQSQAEMVQSSLPMIMITLA